MFSVARVDHFVDITDTYPRRLAALEAHATQTSHMELDARLHMMLDATANLAGLPEGRLAESLSVIATA